MAAVNGAAGVISAKPSVEASANRPLSSTVTTDAPGVRRAAAEEEDANVAAANGSADAAGHETPPRVKLRLVSEAEAENVEVITTNTDNPPPKATLPTRDVSATTTEEVGGAAEVGTEKTGLRSEKTGSISSSACGRPPASGTGDDPSLGLSEGSGSMSAPDLLCAGTHTDTHNGPPPTPEPVLQSAKDDADFIAESSFGGVREGYCFKLGDRGLGYYKEARGATSLGGGLRHSPSAATDGGKAVFHAVFKKGVESSGAASVGDADAKRQESLAEVERVRKRLEGMDFSAKGGVGGLLAKKNLKAKLRMAAKVAIVSKKMHDEVKATGKYKLPQGGKINPGKLPMTDNDWAIKRAKQVPGPGKYGAPKLRGPSGGRMSISLLPSETDLLIKQMKHMPDPGAHQKVITMPKIAGGRFNMAVAKSSLDEAIKRAKESPGPGAYITDLCLDGKGPIFKGRIDRVHRSRARRRAQPGHRPSTVPAKVGTLARGLGVGRPAWH